MITEPGPDWALIRHRYEETADAVADICRDAGVSPRDLERIRRKEKWRRKHPRPFPPPRASHTAQPSTAPSPPPSRGRWPAGPEGGQDTANVSGIADRAHGAAHQAAAESPSPSREAAGEPIQSVAPSTPEQGAEPSDEQLAANTSELFESATALDTAPVIPRRHLATPAARRKLLGRLVAAISMKLEQLERSMTADLAKRDLSANDHERETRAIGALIDNLEKIRELETGPSRTAAKSNATVAATDLADEAERCRRELAERLSRLVEAAGREA